MPVYFLYDFLNQSRILYSFYFCFAKFTLFPIAISPFPTIAEPFSCSLSFSLPYFSLAI